MRIRGWGVVGVVAPRGRVHLVEAYYRGVKDLQARRLHFHRVTVCGRDWEGWPVLEDEETATAGVCVSCVTWAERYKFISLPE